MRPTSTTRVLLIAMALGSAMVVMLLALPHPALPQETLTITGRVVNGTSGAEVPGDLAVLMLITGPDGTLSGTGQTLADPKGGFILEDAPVVTGSIYNLSVDYGGIFYGRSLTLEDLSQDVVITVHETTEDATVMSVERQVMVISEIDTAERVVTATEFVRFTNPTDRTLRPNLETARPGMFSFMRFALPPGAADVRVQSNLSGGEIISVGSGFALAVPVPPGQHSVDFAYTFPYEGGSLEFRNSLPQGAGIFQILVQERWPGVAIGGLTSRPPVGIGEQVYRAWEARDVPAGPGVQLRLDGLPQPGVMSRVGRTLSGSPFWITAIPSAMGAALLSFLVLGLARRYRPATDSEVAAGPTSDLAQAGDSNAVREAQRAELVASLAALDESYEQGGMDEDHYLQHRAELVARALDESSETGA